MPLLQTGGYQVKPSAVGKVKKAIQDFVEYVQTNEPGTQMYLAWQEKDDPTRFLHLFIFADEVKRRNLAMVTRRQSSSSSPSTHRSWWGKRSSSPITR